MRLYDLLNICQEYADLGTAVTGQLRAVYRGEAVADQNRSAMRLVAKLLETIAHACEDDEGEELRRDIASLLEEVRRA